MYRNPRLCRFTPDADGEQAGATALPSSTEIPSNEKAEGSNEVVKASIRREVLPLSDTVAKQHVKYAKKSVAEDHAAQTILEVAAGMSPAKESKRKEVMRQTKAEDGAAEMVARNRLKKRVGRRVRRAKAKATREKEKREKKLAGEMGMEMDVDMEMDMGKGKAVEVEADVPLKAVAEGLAAEMVAEAGIEEFVANQERLIRGSRVRKGKEKAIGMEMVQGDEVELPPSSSPSTGVAETGRSGEKHNEMPPFLSPLAPAAAALPKRDVAKKVKREELNEEDIATHHTALLDSELVPGFFASLITCETQIRDLRLQMEASAKVRLGEEDAQKMPIDHRTEEEKEEAWERLRIGAERFMRGLVTVGGEAKWREKRLREIREKRRRLLEKLDEMEERGEGAAGLPRDGDIRVRHKSYLVVASGYSYSWLWRYLSRYSRTTRVVKSNAKLAKALEMPQIPRKLL